MNFASLEFWVSLIYALIGCFIICSFVAWIKPKYSRVTGKLSFIVTSFYLLGSESILTLLAFVWVIMIGWLIVKMKFTGWITLKEKLLTYFLICLLLGPLFYFKYLGFILNEIFGLGIQSTNMLIPMGLSFYSFQTISFVCDTLKKEEKLPKFIDYLNFASFFPQIVAGPIERKSDLLHQVEKLQFKIKKESINDTVSWIVLGLFYKMALADNIGVYMSKSAIDPDNLWHVIAEIVSYTFRIYFDFSGYSFIALGLGSLFGIKLTLNFKNPYWAINLQDFWRRWHITLSQWLRDYIYFPLGGSRSGILFVNLLITFIISGIWHGAGMNFILWGALHGLGVIYCVYATKFQPKLLALVKLPKVIKWVVTFIFVAYTWLFFFETDTDLLYRKATVFFSTDSYVLPNLNSLLGFVPDKNNLVNFIFIMGISFAVILLEGLSLKKEKPYQILRSLPASVVMAFLIVVFAPVEQSEFIYFNF